MLEVSIILAPNGEKQKHIAIFQTGNCSATLASTASKLCFRHVRLNVLTLMVGLQSQTMRVLGRNSMTLAQ